MTEMPLRKLLSKTFLCESLKVHKYIIHIHKPFSVLRSQDLKKYGNNYSVIPNSESDSFFLQHLQKSIGCFFFLLQLKMNWKCWRWHCVFRLLRLFGLYATKGYDRIRRGGGVCACVCVFSTFQMQWQFKVIRSNQNSEPSVKFTICNTL